MAERLSTDEICDTVEKGADSEEVEEEIHIPTFREAFASSEAMWRYMGSFILDASLVWLDHVEREMLFIWQIQPAKQTSVLDYLKKLYSWYKCMHFFLQLYSIVFTLYHSNMNLCLVKHIFIISVLSISAYKLKQRLFLLAAIRLIT